MSPISAIPSIFNEKLSISNEKPSIPIEKPVFQTKKFEKLDFSHNEYEIPDISSEIRDILKSCNFD